VRPEFKPQCSQREKNVEEKEIRRGHSKKTVSKKFGVTRIKIDKTDLKGKKLVGIIREY
jgi:hypothetical protein